MERLNREVHQHLKEGILFLTPLYNVTRGVLAGEALTDDAALAGDHLYFVMGTLSILLLCIHMRFCVIISCFSL
jgi:hypothetical protein